MKRTMSCCAVFLSLSACAVPGDFCDVVPGEKRFDAAVTAPQMLKTDREDVEQIRVENEYGRRYCSW
ncbi:hypothetical protein [Salipiger bermudensis]|uniref:hypothetical protein n=1 Tax=Salipiger bermudensis TaxID=344736 RepID=UPI001CD1AF86|nr:hypothetical protein [Salipiger bermudensis]MCA0961130.1 hypothetical protein [Salipiger bermudensis]